jgi:hypothetical protein
VFQVHKAGLYFIEGKLSVGLRAQRFGQGSLNIKIIRAIAPGVVGQDGLVVSGCAGT